MSENIKPPSTSIVDTTPSTLVKKHSVSIPSLHARLRNPAASNNTDPSTLANRIALLLDCSGSMSGDKIAKLREAAQAFLDNCDMSNTALAIQTFGGDDQSTGRVPLTVLHPMLMMTILGLSAEGSTPMHAAMSQATFNWPVTRCVLVSDGQPDSQDRAFEEAGSMREAGIICDCVHIGEGTHGEDVLHKIAEITGGMYMKFTDVSAFGKAFKYLTPKYYAMLTGGSVSAAALGAKEIK